MDASTAGHPVKKYSFLWVTTVFFVFSLALHWGFAWAAYKDEQEAHDQPIEFADYAKEVARDTFENWQSEFLQLMWQVAGLAFLLHVGSPQSKEGDERKEDKLDEILKAVNKAEGEQLIKELDRKYQRT